MGIISLGTLIGFIVAYIKIEPTDRFLLFTIATGILAIICFYVYLSNQGQLTKRIEELEEKLKRTEDLIEMKANIIELKRRLK